MISYNWKLSETEFEKNERYVFSCFSCGGGSSFGYKLSGFQVVGCNEIDPKMMECYIANHHPLFPYLCDIREFVKLSRSGKVAKGLFNLDILDGSPPCSSFSMSGNRSNDWGKEKVFREGQSSQVLDTLFFDFIELASILKPKIVIAENVKGLLQGDAIKYVRRIYNEFDNAGYYCQHHLFDASKMGVPQKRERVFFIAIRKDLRDLIPMKDISILNQSPYLDLRFNEKEIRICDIQLNLTEEIKNCCREDWDRLKNKQQNKYLQSRLISINQVHPTVGAGYKSKASPMPEWDSKWMGKNELCQIGSYPLDYNFLKVKPEYLIGMSVPPLMTYGIASRIKEQWFPYIPINENFMDFLWG